MTENKTKRGSRLRIAGVVILALGLLSAGLVYGLSKGREELPDQLTDPAGFKRSARDMNTVFGKVGGFSYGLSEDLKDPAIRAAIIAIGTVIVAAGCFIVAELEDGKRR